MISDPIPTRLPVDTAKVRQVVEAGLLVVDRVVRLSDERSTAFVAALRELHLELAAAEFDAALPPPRVRNGEEPA